MPGNGLASQSSLCPVRPDQDRYHRRPTEGHVGITTTLDLYGHLYPGDMDKYADRLNDAATDAGTAKIRPEDGKDDPGQS